MLSTDYLLAASVGEVVRAYSDGSKLECGTGIFVCDTPSGTVNKALCTVFQAELEAISKASEGLQKRN